MYKTCEKATKYAPRPDILYGVLEYDLNLVISLQREN